MQDNDTLFGFCANAMQHHKLGICYSNAKLVQKVLRYLFENFAIKVTAIKEAKNIDTMIKELIGSLQTIKLNLEYIRKSKGKARKT
ncbi:hypothetical protein J1N35_000680 [Gossypium stocksii]|uniref:Uncharacterized protein n=1 Tax=Gossypium stocksii TaxID=47602 RepID=A0A9D4AKB9_9ROSI|nr:hypothetical protein J1N35_000680 [Gossypium stocksii]